MVRASRVPDRVEKLGALQLDLLSAEPLQRLLHRNRVQMQPSCVDSTPVRSDCLDLGRTRWYRPTRIPQDSESAGGHAAIYIRMDLHPNSCGVFSRDGRMVDSTGRDRAIQLGETRLLTKVGTSRRYSCGLKKLPIAAQYRADSCHGVASLLPIIAFATTVLTTILRFARDRLSISKENTHRAQCSSPIHVKHRKKRAPGPLGMQVGMQRRLSYRALVL